MNSLTELNTYSDSFTITYSDERLGKLILDRTEGTNQSVTANEGDDFNLPVGIEIIEVVNYATTNPTYVIDISAAYGDGVTLDFGTLPAGVSVSNVSGVYTVSGISSAGVWNSIKSPTVQLPTNLPDAFYGNFTVDVDLDWTDALLGVRNISYTVAVSVLDVTFLTNPLESYFDPSATTDISYTPQIVDIDASYPGASFTITATVSSTTPIDTISSSYVAGGTFTFNSGTKGFTIVGSRTNVNGHLANLSLTATSSGSDFTITYLLSNDQDGTTDSKIQTLRNSDVRYLSSASNGTYVEDTLSSISGYPTITDNNYTGPGTYTLTVTPDSTSKVSKIYGSERDQISTSIVGTIDSLTTTVSITQLVVGQQYIIVYIGDAGNESNFTTVGASVNSVGTIFTATGTGTGGGLVESYPVLRAMKFLNTSDGTGNSLKFGSQSPISDAFRFGNYTNYTLEMWIKTVAAMSSSAPATGPTSACSFFIGRNDQTVTSSFGFNKDGRLILNWYNDITGFTYLNEGVDGTATITSNQIVSTISITSGGSGYISAPTVTISAPASGTTATASASINGSGVVTSISIINPGSGYTSAPTVTISAPTSGTTATASASIGIGITGITLTSGGSGYTSAPTVTISAPASGTTATASASISNGSISAITLTNAGSGYTSVPTVTISGGISSQQLDTWQHIAFVKQGSTVKLYVNGIAKATGTMTTLLPRYDNLGQDVYPAIGGHYYGNHSQIREFRVSNTARYTTTFTPSSGPFTNDANTLCLIHGSNTGGTYIDINTSRDGTFADDNTDIITSGDESFNDSTKVLTITGTKSIVNQRLGYLKIKPARDIDSTILLTYDLTTPESNTADKEQNLLISGNDTEMSNGSVTRSYIGNNVNLLFASNTPQIIDNEPPGYITTYTVFFSCAFGNFTLDDVNYSSPFSISGTRQYINNTMASIKFYPNVNVSSNGTMTMQLQKNSVTTATFTINLTGTAGTYDNGRDIAFLTTQSWTPTIADVLYGKISEVTVVGGGGGGSVGGGGGGQVKYTATAGDITNNGILSLQSYSITVGAGGTVGNSTVGASGSDGGVGGSSSGFGITAVGGGGGKKVSSYNTSTPSLTGGEGGYSYAPDGTLYQGGNSSILILSFGKVYINGGGGAGSGGRNTRTTALDIYDVDAPTNVNDTAWGRNGGLGYYADLGGILWTATNYPDAPNFGFGAGGGQWGETTGGGGGVGGYENPSTSYDYSNAAERYYDASDGNPNITYLGTNAQDSPRTAAVAGGGGAGGAAGFNGSAPPLPGGDGIVIIRISAQ